MATTTTTTTAMTQPPTITSTTATAAAPTTKQRRASNAATAAAAAAAAVASDAAAVSSPPPHRPPKILLNTVNPHIICNLCKGYLIDATTIVECLHSFCHSCLMKHLLTEQYCPECEMMINKAKPNIKSDSTLQAMVNKLVPGLYEKELRRRREFYKLRPEDAMKATPEQRGDDTEHLIFSLSENISLSLEYADLDTFNDTTSLISQIRYLQCPAMFTVGHLKKYVIGKFGIDCTRFCIDIMYKVKTIVLPEYYTLVDVAYIYTWKRDAPMRFFYRVKSISKFQYDELPEVPLRRSPSVTINMVDSEIEDDSSIKANESAAQTEIIPVVEPKSLPAVPKSGSPKLHQSSPAQEAAKLQKTESSAVISGKQVCAKNNNENNKKVLLKSILKDSTKSDHSPLAIVINEDKQKDDSVAVVVSSPKSTDNKTDRIVLSPKCEKNKNNRDIVSPKTDKPKDDRVLSEPPKVERRDDLKMKIDLSRQKIIISTTSEGKLSDKSEGKREEKEKKSKVKKEKSEEKAKRSHDKSFEKLMKKAKVEKKIQKLNEKIGATVPDVNSEKKSEKLVITKNGDTSESSEKKVDKLVIAKHCLLTGKPFVVNMSEITDVIKSGSGKKSQEVKDFKSPKEIKTTKNKEMSVSSGLCKISPKPSSPRKIEAATVSKVIDEKSQFLNAFNLAPKSSTNSSVKTSSVSPPVSVTSKVRSFPISKRKAKEPIKNISKKSRVDSPKPVTDKIPIKPLHISKTSIAPPSASISFQLAPYPIGSSGTTLTTTAGGLTSANDDAMKMLPPSIIPPLKSPAPIIPEYFKKVPKPIKAAKDVFKKPAVVKKPKAMKSITKKTQNILPKPFYPGDSPRPHNERYNFKFASPEPRPIQPKDVSPLANGLSAPLGIRPSVYAPLASPIYSPNSPQYAPNYNIPTQPQFKYMKSPSYVANFLQNNVGIEMGNQPPSTLKPFNPHVSKPMTLPVVKQQQQQQQLPPPPTPLLPLQQHQQQSAQSSSSSQMKMPTESANVGKQVPAGSINSTNNNNKHQSPVTTSQENRKHKIENQSDANEPAAKKTRVKSLLDSCNITIPSSLSVTLMCDQSDSSAQRSNQLKRTGPVKNYIEIVKLPDNNSEKRNPTPPLATATTVTTSSNIPSPVSSPKTTTVPAGSPKITAVPSVPPTKTRVPSVSPPIISLPSLSPPEAHKNSADSSIAMQKCVAAPGNINDLRTVKSNDNKKCPPVKQDSNCSAVSVQKNAAASKKVNDLTTVNANDGKTSPSSIVNTIRCKTEEALKRPISATLPNGDTGKQNGKAQVIAAEKSASEKNAMMIAAAKLSYQEEFMNSIKSMQMSKFKTIAEFLTPPNTTDLTKQQTSSTNITNNNNNNNKTNGTKNKDNSSKAKISPPSKNNETKISPADSTAKLAGDNERNLQKIIPSLPNNNALKNDLLQRLLQMKANEAAAAPSRGLDMMSNISPAAMQMQATTNGLLQNPAMLPHAANIQQYISNSYDMIWQRAYYMEQLAKMRKRTNVALDDVIQSWRNEHEATGTAGNRKE